MEVEEVVKCGSLYVPPQGFLRQKKSWHKKYCVLYNSSRQGIQRLELFDTEDQYLKQNNCLRIIGLSECLKVAPAPQKQQSNVFEIRTKESSNLFSSETFSEMTEWLNCLQSVAFGALPSHPNNHPTHNSRPTVGFPLDSNANQFNHSTALTLNNLNDNQSEDNLLYSSVDAPDVYRVKLIDSETSIRCGLRSGFDSNFSLVVTSLNISLAEEGKVLFTWPYRHIRRYGCTKDGFSLEAGRKCASGEGLFSFITKDGNYIFQAVASHVNSLKTSPNMNDDNSLGFNSMSGHEVSPKIKSKEIVFSSVQSNKPSLPSTSPPLSSSYLSKSNYLATNSSLLPSTKISETTKRYSIQPPKSPQMVPKKPLTRMTSANTMIAISDLKPRTSPPIPKPPRKSKDTKTSESSEEPLFATREDVMGLKPMPNDSAFNHKPVNDEVLYDEPGDPSTHSDSQNEEQRIKSPFCPSPPPVNHTVSKLTSVLKMMFTEKRQNTVHPKHKDKRVSSRSSTGSSTNTSVASSPVRTTAAVQHIDSDDLGYAQVIDFIKRDKNRSDVNFDNDSNHYSKILNDSSDGVEHHSEHQYANVVHKDINDLNKVSDNCDQNDSQTEHYVQNECEYARVVKRSMNNSPP